MIFVDNMECDVIDVCNLIFADVCHNIKEFGYNFPRLLQLASPSCVFAIHDMTFDISPLDYHLITIAKSGSLLCFTHNNI